MKSVWFIVEYLAKDSIFHLLTDQWSLDCRSVSYSLRWNIEPLAK